MSELIQPDVITAYAEMIGAWILKIFSITRIYHFYYYKSSILHLSFATYKVRSFINFDWSLNRIFKIQMF